MATEAAYDRIGRGYSIGRRTDPRHRCGDLG